MNLKKRILTLMTLVALMGSSMMTIGTSVAGQQIDTSIEVLDTLCTDAPTTLSLSVIALPSWIPNGNSPFPNQTQYPNSSANAEAVRLDMNVSDCAGGFTVNATIGDFTSGSNSFSGPDHFRLLLRTSSGRALQDSQTCVPGFGCFPSLVEHMGTSGPGAFGASIALPATPALLTGDATAVGPMYGSWGIRWAGLDAIAASTPPGVYQAELTMTFTPTNP